ncbi:probable leucine-rich repeat receptor-like protein kinase At1g68400 [Arachis duranensis]|uniref:Probable leucine-rich repeat receptor-like protein kinase At1g68400 n=1 Tax=Arachis duranensis TaxID=130453 RepID=A0A6P4C5W5_ARADU|nr:probable leucine-rich repeat receptor-like protein kinase At1g68400 [Arachis duranensis]
MSLNLMVLLLLVSLNMLSCDELKEEKKALLVIRDSLSSSANLHENWTDSPCIGNQSRWKGIICSNWHVVQIILEDFNLRGSLPSTCLQKVPFLKHLNLGNNSVLGLLPNLTNLVFLEQVLLSYNHFSGPIPLEYAHGLPNLKVLELQENYLDGQIPSFDQPALTSFNVSYNHLWGTIPETSALQRFSDSSFDHNSDLCGKPLDKLCPSSPPAGPSSAPYPSVIPRSSAAAKHEHTDQVRVIVLIVASGAILLLVIISVFLVYNKGVPEKEARNGASGYTFGAWARNIVSENEDYERLGRMEYFSKELAAFDIDDLLRASAEMLGKGNLGITYKATLETGIVLAVKRLSHMNELSRKEFTKQMQVLGELKHENLVEIISFYHSEEQKLIIHEFISNGSLFDLLHENRGVGRKLLDWNARLTIIKDIAKGVDFLHHSLASHKVPHGNLKSSNVLIHHHDNQGNHHAKLTNFGFLTLLPNKKSAEKLAISKSPEFVQGRKLTHKTDVYCFGIIVLEVITGKIPGEMFGVMGMEEEEEEKISDLSDWVRMVVNNDWSTDILDIEMIAAKEGHDSMLKLTQIALECTDDKPEKRPKISEVLRRMEEIEKTKNGNLIS